MNLTYLEGWGFIAIVVVCGGLGYLLAASLKTFYEGRSNPRWLTLLCIALTTVGICGGTALAILAALNHW